MSAGDVRNELASAQAELEAIDNKIAWKQAEAQAAKDKNERASLRLEVQSAERQKAAATRRLKAAQVRLRKMELTSAEPSSISTAMDGTAPAEDDWKEHVDPQTGSRFYFNTKTGESSWTRPAPVVQSTVANALAMPEEQARAAAKVEDWTEHVDPQSGRTFYYNARTGETSWTKPDTACQEQQLTQPAGAVGVQDDWTEHLDSASGNKFYYNTRTGETSWTRPEPAIKEMQAQQPLATAPDSEWTENVDPSTGQKFYFNVLTRESSWTKPSTAPQQPLQIVQPMVAIGA